MTTDRTVLVRLKANVSDFAAGMMTATRSVNSLRKEIDTTNDRVAWMAQGFLGLGPALVPLGAAAVPALAGLTTQLGLTIAATGTAVMAFQGVGDALKALNDYQLEPTEEHLNKLRETMAKIGPEGREFVRFLDEVAPRFAELQDAARAGMFPGMEKGIRELTTMLPQVEQIIYDIGRAIGRLSREAGEGLSGEGFEDFFAFLERQAKPMLVELGHTIGNFVEGFAAMVVAFEPLSTRFSKGLLGVSEAFAEWAHGLDSSESFADFLTYVEHAGPMVLDLFGSLVNMFVQIAEAAAPVGDILVPALTVLADVVASMANTPLAPMFIAATAALSLYGRAAALASVTSGGLTGKLVGLSKTAYGLDKDTRAAFPSMQQWGRWAEFMGQSTENASKKTLAARGAVHGWAKSMAPAAAGMAGLGLVATGTADKMGLANTATLALAGSMAGPWGAAAGAVIGLGMDIAGTNDDVTASIERMQSAFDGITDPRRTDLSSLKSQLEQTRAEVDGFQKDMDDIDWFGHAVGPGDLLKGAKNDIEGLFGMSDNEENQAALKELEKQYLDVAAAVASVDGGQYMAAAEGMAEADRQQAEAAERAVTAMRAKRQEALRGVNAELDYQQAIDDARKSLKENGKTVDETTDKGRANLRTLYQLAGAWNAQDDATKNAKGSMEAARRNFIQTATDMGMPIRKAKELADRLFEIPANRTVKIAVETDTAVARLIALKNRMDAIRNKDVWVNVHSNGASRPMGGPIVDGAPSADGGTVPKTGMPYADRHLYLLADGEEVISNRHGQADRHRALLKAINDRQLADGGTAGRSYMTDFGFGGAALMRSGAQQMQWFVSEVGHAAEGAKSLKEKLKDAQKALEKETRQRDAISEKMSSLSSGVTSGLRSDIFARPEGWSPWATSTFGGGGGANAVLDADSAVGDEWIDLVKQLKNKGVKDEALAEILSRNDIDLLREYAAMSRTELAAYVKKFNRREKILAAAGVASGQAAYGAAFDAAVDEWREANQHLKAIQKAIDKADKGNRKGHQENAEQVSQSWQSAAGNARRRARRRRTDG